MSHVFLEKKISFYTLFFILNKIVTYTLLLCSNLIILFNIPYLQVWIDVIIIHQAAGVNFVNVAPVPQGHIGEHHLAVLDLGQLSSEVVPEFAQGLKERHFVNRPG